MKTFLIFMCLLLPIIGTSQTYTISGNYTYGMSIFNLDKTSFSDLRNERRITSGNSYGISVGKFYKKGYYQKKFLGVKVEINKFNYNQNFRLVPDQILITSLRFIEKRIEVDGYSITPLICYYPSVGQSFFIELGPSFNQILSNRQYVVSNNVGFDKPLVPYEFKKNFFSIYLRTGTHINLSDWVGFSIGLFSKTNITPIEKDNGFNSYFFGADIGITFRIKK
jgi:hypothetical protein